MELTSYAMGKTLHKFMKSLKLHARFSLDFGTFAFVLGAF
jgi:hypothetical protein